MISSSCYDRIDPNYFALLFQIMQPGESISFQTVGSDQNNEVCNVILNLRWQNKN